MRDIPWSQLQWKAVSQERYIFLFTLGFRNVALNWASCQGEGKTWANERQGERGNHVSEIDQNSCLTLILKAKFYSIPLSSKSVRVIFVISNHTLEKKMH